MKRDRMARIAFVGAGLHATESLYPNIAHIPEFDLVAVCDLDAAKAAHAARRFGARKHFTDVEAMLTQVKPDGVCVCGPPAMHHGVGLQCLARGVPIFIEKPPAQDLAGAEELAQAADERGVFGMVGFMKRFAPANRVALEFMGSSAFGQVSSLSLIHGSGPYDDPYKMMIFNGIHLIDLARFLGGHIVELSAYATPAYAACKAFSLSFRYQSGHVGTLNMNSGHSWQDCFESVYVSGTEAALVIDASRSVQVMAQNRRFAEGQDLSLFGWSSQYQVSGNMAGWWASGHYTRGYWGELSHFARACLGQVAPTPTLDEGVQAMRVINAAFQSARSGGVPVRPGPC